MKWLLLIALSINFNLAFSQERTFDQNLDTSAPYIPLEGSNDFFYPDQTNYTKLKNSNEIQVEILLNLPHGEKVTVGELTHDIFLGFKRRSLGENSTQAVFEDCKSLQGKLLRAETPLSHPLWGLENHKSDEYELFYKAKCGYKTQLVFDYKSFGGGAITLWYTMDKIVKKLKSIDRFDFWQEKLYIVWPDGGNFYDYTKVHIDKAWMWDIVGHEIGHAIYDRANVGIGAGGVHFIDRCYSENLAFSEGWASFFSAWVFLDLNDSQAAFEYMVPRRAPLGVEHIPSDVCQGPGNEWRVFTFLWDIIDHHEDGESMKIPFQELWDLTRELKARSVVKVKETLLKAGYDPVLLEILWKQNLYQ